MSNQLILGILLNTVCFGIMGFRNNRLGIKIPNWLKSEIFGLPLLIVDLISFIIILLSPEIWWLKIIIALSMQFLVNHIIWGMITGITAGLISKNNK